MNSRWIPAVVLGTVCSALSPLAAAVGEHQFSADFGYTDLDNGYSSDEVLTTSLGYSYYITSFVAVDLGYNGTLSSKAKLRDSNGNAIETKYDSYYGGARIEVPFSSFATVFARGGAAYTELKEENVSANPSSSTTHSGVNPYVSAGARIQMPNNPNVQLSAEITYQDLEHGYDSTSVSVGARFRL